MVESVKGYSEEQGSLIADFILVMRDLRDKGLTDKQMEIIQLRHYEIVEKCIDLGLTEELCTLRDNWKEYYGEGEK